MSDDSGSDPQLVRLDLDALSAMEPGATFRFLADLSRTGARSALDKEKAPAITLMGDSGASGEVDLTNLRALWSTRNPGLLSPASKDDVDAAAVVDPEATVTLVATAGQPAFWPGTVLSLGPAPSATDLINAALGTPVPAPSPPAPAPAPAPEENAAERPKTDEKESAPVTPVAPPPATAPTGPPAPTAVAFPSTDLTAMLEPTWAVLADCPASAEPEDWTRQQQIASRLWDQLLDDRAAQTLAAKRQAGPDIELLEWALHKGVGTGVIEPFLKVRLGTPDHANELQSQETALATAAATKAAHQAATVEKANVLLDDAHDDRTTWRELAGSAQKLLVPAMVVATLGLLLIIALLFLNNVDGYEAALLIFVLALFSISPIVLLLLERPLKGIDTFTPNAQPAAAAETKKT